MDHHKIEQEKIIERYIGGKLTKKEERAFEEHYFGCDQCFDAVKEMEKVIEASQKVAEGVDLIKPAKKPAFSLLEWLKSRFLIPVPIPALGIAAVLVLALLYPAYRGIFTMKHLEKQLNQPRANVPIFYLEKTKDARETEILEIKLERPDDTFILNFNILERKLDKSKFRAEILDQQGKVIWQSDHLKGLGEYEVFSIACSGSFFHTGKYILKVYEIDSATQKHGKEFSYQFEIIKK